MSTPAAGYRSVAHDVTTTLWTKTSPQGRVVECVLRLVPTGIEVAVFSGHAPLYSRIFTDGKAALAWVEEERAIR
jgi:hypothetical protein